MSKTEKKTLESGKHAPDFVLLNHLESPTALKDFRGKFVVLYFYPKDNTPGCTTEALEFQERVAQFEAENAVIVGISPDNAACHARFMKKQGLHFQLLADTDHAVASRYGVWVEKSMYGKKFMGVQRATFLVDPDGLIEHCWPKVRPKGHAEAVLEHLKSIR